MTVSRHFSHESNRPAGPAFIDAHWQRAPGVLRGWPTRRLASRADVVEGLARIARRHRRGRLATGLRVYAGGREVSRDPGGWLPRPGEPGPLYARRVGARGTDGLVVAAQDFQVYSPAVWFAVRRFLTGLIARTGLPAQRATILACLGNFLELPYGMHPAAAHNFLLVCEGRAAVRVWAPAVFTGDGDRWLHRTDYSSMVRRSVLLEGRSGDILSWPAGWWHANECRTPSLSVGLNILLFPKPCVDQGPIVRSTALGRDERIAALDHASASGFAPVPEAAAVRRLRPDQRVRGRMDAAVVWRRWGRRGLHCSANGRSFVTPRCRGLVGLLEWTGTGEIDTVSRLAERHSNIGAISRADVIAVLEKLHQLRALEICPVGSRGVQDYHTGHCHATSAHRRHRPRSRDRRTVRANNARGPRAAERKGPDG